MARNQLAPVALFDPFVKQSLETIQSAKRMLAIRFLLEHSVGMTVMITMMTLLRSSIQDQLVADQCITTMIII